jgi:Tol biopolymer transport system component
MTLSAGAKLGPYEILSPLGAGGMGEVYKARDTRLERTVAVKVLPQHMSSSAEVRQRFEREAKTISQLSHPHICALYDVGREGETEYLVMEYLEGETLSERLAKSPLPLEQTLRYGQEIADALDKAHRQGIVHRDLKPANVMLTKSGVKLLDFGLAKAMAPAAPQSSLTSLPTQHGLTQEGTILGTFQYMAPEQLEGKDADARTDIWAFGCVLYEMATGRKTFSGATHASLITAIMSAQAPSIASVQAMSPQALDRVVKTCLDKDPERRWQSAADVGQQLRWIGDEPSSAPARPAARRREWLAWVLAAAAALAAAVALLRTGDGNASRGYSGSVRSAILLPGMSTVRALALSPDGTQLALVARDASGRNLLWVRPLDSSVARPLSGTENPSLPFWSPDGRSIGFFADGKLKRIDTLGEPPLTICDAPVARGGAWNQDGVILFSPVTDGPLYRVDASGGKPTAVTKLDAKRGESSHRWPVFLPGGKRFLYLVASFGVPREGTGIYVGSLDSNEETLLVRAGANAAYVPPGYLVYYREGNLLAQRLDAKIERPEGEPFALAEDIQFFPQQQNALFSASLTGVLVSQPRSDTSVSQLTWLDRSGKVLGTLGPPANQSNPRIAPDGKRVALDIVDPQTGNIDVWIYASGGGLPTRMTSDPSIDSLPVWSPDGRRLAFMSLRRSHPDIYVTASDGASGEELVLESGRAKYVTDWSPDGRFLLFRASDATTNLELWTLPVGGDGKPIPFRRASYGVGHGQFSPDGRWIAYASNETGRSEIHVAPFPGPGSSWRVSTAGGTEPRWRRDGKELYYLAPDGKLMVVGVSTGPPFEADVAKPLFQVRRRERVSASDQYGYDVSADGQRFLVSAEIGEESAPPLSLVTNWVGGLRK